MTFQRRRGRMSTEKTEVRICVLLTRKRPYIRPIMPVQTRRTHTPIPMSMGTITGIRMSTTRRRRPVALLAYMVTHNQHHAEELHELAHSVEGEAAQLLHEAVVDLTVGNEKLAEALRILKGEE